MNTSNLPRKCRTFTNLTACFLVVLLARTLSAQGIPGTLLDAEEIRSVLLVPFPFSYPNDLPRNHAPTINAKGETAFPIVTQLGVGGPPVTSVWFEANSATQLLMGEVFDAPGIPGDVQPVLGAAFPPSYNAKRRISVRGGLTGEGVTTSNDLTLWSGPVSALRVIAREGFAAPDVAVGIHFKNFGLPSLNSHGAVSFNGTLTGPGVDSQNEKGIWVDDGTSGRLLVREGDAAPGTEANTVFDSLEQPQIVESGDVLFIGTLRGPSGRLNQQIGRGYWAERNGQIEKVARGGDPAPGFNGDTEYSFVTGAHMNRSGDIAFYASLTGPAVRPGTDAIWREDQGVVKLVAMEGQPAPVGLNGVTIGEMEFLISHNNNGDVAWRGEVAGVGLGISEANNDTLFVSKDGNLEVVAREGDPVPGSSGSSTETFRSFSYPVLNDQGQVAFLAETSNSRLGIWAQDISGGLQMIALENAEFDVDDTAGVDMRTIQRLRFYDGRSGQDGSLTGFNDHGQIGFAAQFSDGTQGIFVSDRVLIPEPGVLSLALYAILLICTTRATSPQRVARGEWA